MRLCAIRRSCGLSARFLYVSAVSVVTNIQTTKRNGVSRRTQVDYRYTLDMGVTNQQRSSLKSPARRYSMSRPSRHQNSRRRGGQETELHDNEARLPSDFCPMD